MRYLVDRTCDSRFEHVGDQHLTLGSLYVLYFVCVATSLLVLTLELCVFYNTAAPKSATIGKSVKKATLCPVQVVEQLAFQHELAELEKTEK